MEIIFYAPLGSKIPKEKIGGAEAGCLKTLGIYREHDVKVHTVEKAAKTNGTIPYLFATLSTYLKLCGTAIRYRNAIVHIVGFYDKILSWEWLLVKTAKLLGNRVVYEMRNGGLETIYLQKDSKYRNRQKDIWMSADGLLCQGEIFCKLIARETGRNSLYYPNYIPDRFMKPLGERQGDKMNLVFFGRLVPAKNIDVIIRSTALIKEKYPNVHLNLIGGVSDEYSKELEDLIGTLGLQDNVTLHGRQNFDYIYDILQQSHFFMFPSNEPNEGHSNSLTEAMGCGVVPIVSTAGFSRSICGNDDLVVESFTPEDYANKVINITQSGKWENLSESIYNRIRDNYTQKAVGASLIEYMSKVANQ